MSIGFRQHPRTTPRHTHHIHRLDTGKDDDRQQRGQGAPVLDACHSARHRYPIGGRPEHNHDQSTTTESPHHQVPPRGSRHGPLPTGHTHPTARGQLQGAVKEAPKSSPPSWAWPTVAAATNNPLPDPDAARWQGRRQARGQRCQALPQRSRRRRRRPQCGREQTHNPWQQRSGAGAPLSPGAAAGKGPSGMSRANRRGRSDATPTLGAQMPLTSGHSGGDDTQQI
jgi:hypothetical protein